MLKRWRLTTVLGSILGLLMVMAAMWAWNHAYRLAAESARPDVTLWALRSAAVALAAGAQAVLATFVVSRVYQPILHRRWPGARDAFCERFGAFAGVVAAIALVSAIALGLAGR